MSGTPEVVPHLTRWIAWLTQAWCGFTVPGSPSITRVCVRDWCCTYPVLSPGHRFVFSFPFLIISGHRVGRSFLTSLPQQGINSDLWPLIPFSLKCQCYIGLLLFVKISTSDDIRRLGILNNERFFFLNQENRDIYIFYVLRTFNK